MDNAISLQQDLVVENENLKKEIFLLRNQIKELTEQTNSQINCELLSYSLNSINQSILVYLFANNN